MSHKASSWLAEIPASDLSASEFRVLFHLCNAHNSLRDPETACFPKQGRLREATGLSNGGLNNALNGLEESGFIRRVRSTEPGGRVQRTYYILGFDLVDGQEQTPKNGVGTNSTFDGTNSTLEHNKLHISGVGNEPVRNREKEQGSARDRADDLFSEEPERKSQEGDPFEDFWSAYPHNPKRRDKKTARTRFWAIVQKRAKDLERYASADELIAAAKKFAASKPETEFVPGAEVWLSKARWLGFLGDQPDAPKTYAQRVLAQYVGQS